jgi:hypothetical protein
LKKFFLAISTYITLIVGQNCGAEESINAREFMLNHRAIGKLRVLTSPDAVKVNILNNQTELISKAPDWHVVISRPSTKISMVYSLKQWKTRSIGILDGKPPAKLEYKESSPFPFKGVQLTLLKGKAAITATDATYLVLKNKTPTQLNAVLIRFFRLPGVDGMPLAYEETSGESYQGATTTWLTSQRKLNESRRSIRVLNLNSIKDVKVPAREFSYPQGFKTTVDERDIYITNGRSEMMNALTNFGMEERATQAAKDAIQAAKSK